MAAPQEDAGGAFARAGALLLLCAFAVAGCGGRPRNVVLVSVDTLRADHLGSAGYSRDTTPSLDRYFSRGSVFEQAISSAPCTVPSVLQLLSGSFETGDGRPTLAEALRGLGFATQAVVSQQQFHKELASYRRGFDGFDIQAPDAVDGHGLSTRSAAEVSDRALEWLEQAPGDRPFFLWLHYFDPHDPYEPPAEFRAFDSGNRSRRSGDRRGDLQREKRTPGEPARDAGYIFTPEDVQHLVNLYDGEIRYADHEIGRVLDFLDARGLTGRSIVALTADHGERLGRGGHWDHCASLGEEELHVPLLVRAAGGPLAGRARVGAAASTLDLVPTILALLGAAREPGLPYARDLRRLGEQGSALAFWRGRWAVRRADWKLVSAAAGAPAELYALGRDPLEAENLAGRGEAAEAQLSAELEPLAALGRRLASESARRIQELRALGYLE